MFDHSFPCSPRRDYWHGPNPATGFTGYFVTPQFGNKKNPTISFTLLETTGDENSEDCHVFSDHKLKFPLSQLRSKLAKKGLKGTEIDKLLFKVWIKPDTDGRLFVRVECFLENDLDHVFMSRKETLQRPVSAPSIAQRHEYERQLQEEAKIKEAKQRVIEAADLFKKQLQDLQVIIRESACSSSLVFCISLCIIDAGGHVHPPQPGDHVRAHHQRHRQHPGGHVRPAVGAGGEQLWSVGR